jgi:diguanylate cyclase (GGDEF)-like protein/PAS domain S-box-containing protein
LRNDGRRMWVNTRSEVILDVGGELLGMRGMVQDITERKQADDVTLQKQAEVELKLAANVHQNILEAVMVSDAQGLIMSVNPAFRNITGYSAEEAMGQTHSLLKSNRQERESHRAIWQQIMITGKWQGEIWQRRKNGDIFLVHKTITSIAGAAGETEHYVSVFYDITDVWQKNENIRYLAFHDALTGLSNCSLLMERLDRHITLARRDPRPLAVLFRDLDRFKFVNDNLGHDVGDDLLVAVAQKLQALIKKPDTVARLGGDEFNILLDNPASKDEVEHISNRIITAINEPINFHGKTAQVATSTGIVMYPGDAVSGAELIKCADSAMYEAKNAGKNTFRFFHAGTNEAV